MAKTLPLEEMTLQEKLAAMELLWDDLARCPESVESPTWHKDILDERHQRVAEAEAQFGIGRAPKRRSEKRYCENRDPG